MSVRVFLLGETGAIGGHALSALVAAGHEVSALVRTPEKAAVVEARGAEPVVVSMFDPTALLEAFRGHDAVVNLATSMPSTATFLFRRAWQPTERVRIRRLGRSGEVLGCSGGSATHCVNDRRLRRQVRSRDQRTPRHSEAGRADL